MVLLVYELGASQGEELTSLHGAEGDSEHHVVDVKGNSGANSLSLNLPICVW